MKKLRKDFEWFLYWYFGVKTEGQKAFEKVISAYDLIIEGAEKDRDELCVEQDTISALRCKLQLKVWQYEFERNWYNKNLNVATHYIRF